MLTRPKRDICGHCELYVGMGSMKIWPSSPTLDPQGHRGLIFHEFLCQILSRGVHKAIIKDKDVYPYGPHAGMFSGLNAQNNSGVA